MAPTSSCWVWPRPRPRPRPLRPSPWRGLPAAPTFLNRHSCALTCRPHPQEQGHQKPLRGHGSPRQRRTGPAPQGLHARGGGRVRAEASKPAAKGRLHAIGWAKGWRAPRAEGHGTGRRLHSATRGSGQAMQTLHGMQPVDTLHCRVSRGCMERTDDRAGGHECALGLHIENRRPGQGCFLPAVGAWPTGGSAPSPAMREGYRARELCARATTRGS